MTEFGWSTRKCRKSRIESDRYRHVSISCAKIPSSRGICRYLSASLSFYFDFNARISSQSSNSPATTADGWKHWCTEWTKSTIFIRWFNRIISTAVAPYIFATHAAAGVLFVRLLIISCTPRYRIRFYTRHWRRTDINIWIVCPEKENDQEVKMGCKVLRQLDGSFIDLTVGVSKTNNLFGNKLCMHTVSKFVRIDDLMLLPQRNRSILIVLLSWNKRRVNFFPQFFNSSISNQYREIEQMIMDGKYGTTDLFPLPIAISFVPIMICPAFGYHWLNGV